MIKPQVLILGPGGEKGLYELGALMYLNNNHLLDDVKIYAGVSVGAIISLLLVCDYTPSKIIAKALEIDFFRYFEHPDLELLLREKGLITHQPIRQILTELVEDKYGFVPTLGRLYELTGRELMAVATDMNQQRPVYLNYHTTPELNCIEAVIMSSSIPLIFTQIEWGKYLFVDGFLSNPYPVDYYDNKGNTILGIYIKTLPPEGKRLDQYVYMILSTMGNILQERITRSSSSSCHHLLIEIPFRYPIALNVDNNNNETLSRHKMILHGFRVAENFFAGPTDSN